MNRRAFRSALCTAFLLPTAWATPPQRALEPPPDPAMPATTISSEPYQPKQALTLPPVPSCQLKIGSDWSETPTPTLDACAALLDQKTPAQPKQMSTAYWSGMYLSADARSIYRADAKSDWIVLRARSAR